MNKRKLRLEKYGISNKRYKELCGFCEQYPEWKQELENYSYLSAINYSGMPKSPNQGQSKQTEETAIRIEKLLSKCMLIEETAKAVDNEFWEFIIRSACYEENVNYLRTVKGLRLSTNAFYERRRYFFYLLNKKKEI